MLCIVLVSLLISQILGENVSLQPGKVHEYAIDGYPNIKSIPGQQTWTFQSAPGSQIITYCSDFRMIPNDKNPCDYFQLTVSDGVTEKKFCRNGDKVNFKSSGPTLTVEMKYDVGGLVTCVARSTEEYPGKEIIIDSTEPQIVAQERDERTPYLDETWVIKSANNEKVIVDCRINSWQEDICYREYVTIDNGLEKKEVCDNTDLKFVSNIDVIKIRAIQGPDAIMRFQCRAYIKGAPKPTEPPVTKKTSEPTSFTINPGQAIAFDSYEADYRGTLVYNFQTTDGSGINIACEQFSYHPDGTTDPCEKLQINFVDGSNNFKFCVDKQYLNYYSKGPSVKMEVKYEAYRLKCVARSSAIRDPTEVLLKVEDGIYSFKHPTTPVPWYDGSWVIKSVEGTKVSLQCEISNESFDDGKACLMDTVRIGNGEKEDLYCGAKKVVVFSKDRTVTVHAQLNSFGDGSFFCRAQAVTGPDPNQENNLEVEESAENAGEGLGKKGTTCPCGARNHGKSNTRIFYGNVTKESEYPWMAGIRDHDNYQRCGGSIITAYHILTAAHCMVDSKKRKKDEVYDTVVYVGAHHLKQDASHGKTKGYEVQEVFIPEEWWQWKKPYDLSVLFLKEKIEFSKYVSPVCLPPNPIKLLYRTVRAVGWGQTETGSAIELKTTKLFVLDKSSCGDAEEIICSYRKGTSTCFGDSGGPLLFLEPETNRYIQIGVVSYGNYPYCESRSGYANTSYHYEYISNIVQRTMPSAQICSKVD